VMWTFPGRSTSRTGWRPGRMPMSPSAAGTLSADASPLHRVRYGATLWTVSATAFGLLLDLRPVALEVRVATDVEERLLRHVVVLAVGDPAERLDGLGDRHGGALDTGELHRGVGVLREELLDAAGPRDGDLVLLGQLVDTEDRDDVLQLLVLLQDRLHPGGDLVVLLAHVLRAEAARGGGQRVHRGVQTTRGDLTRELGGGVQVREGRRRRRAGVVVGGHVERLQGGDRVAARGGDALLEDAHLVGEVRLVADRGGHAAQQRGDLRAGLGEA